MPNDCLIPNYLDFTKYQTDPYYKHLTRENAIKAGWIDMNVTDDILSEWLSSKIITSSLYQILEMLDSISLNDSDKYVYLVTSGSFAPLHHGHISMMNKAKQYFESLGCRVIGGQFSPSHDAYVSVKLNRHDYNIYNRLEQCMSLLYSESNTEWLTVDCWEGLVVTSHINFSFLLERVYHYLCYHFPVLKSLNFNVVYVFGDDNIGFTDAFRETGICACVSRTCTDIPLRSTSNNIHYVTEKNEYTQLSSSKLRNDDVIVDVDSTNKVYIIRDDLHESTSAYNMDVDSLKVFKDSILSIFTNFLLPFDINVMCFKYAYPELDSSILSLDAWFKGHYKLNVSRLFNLSDGQFKALKMVKSCGERRSILSQIQRIPDDDFVLVDDDISTGFTTNHIKKMIGTHSNADVIAIASLLAPYSKNFTTPVYDVVDCRDFLFGSVHGGLTVQLINNMHVRVPYVYPYVNLKTRASVSNKLSSDIVKANVVLYKHNQHIKVSDLPAYSQEFFKFLGFESHTSLFEVCKWHLRTYFHENT